MQLDLLTTQLFDHFDTKTLFNTDMTSFSRIAAY